MKFIIPSNYTFQSKFLGILDYNTVFFNVIWDSFIFSMLNLIFSSINIKVIFFIILCLPLLIISIVGFNHENIIYVFTYVIKFYINRNLYLYKKY